MQGDESFPLALRLWLGVLLAAAVLGTGLRDAQACSCVPFTLESRYESSANVFTAIVTTEYLEPADERTPIRSLFRVTESFKGGPPFGMFTSHPEDGTCGIDLQEGVEYLFFAPDSGEINYCSGISTTDRARPEIESLRSYVSGESSGVSEPWRFSRYVSGECSLNALFDFGGGFGQGHLRVLASNERAVWARGSPQFDFAELAIYLEHRFPTAIETRSPLKLAVGSVVYAADWTTGRAHDQETPNDGTVRASLPDAYVLLGNEVEELLRILTVSDALLVQYDGQGYEPNREVEVRTANLADAGFEMQECMQTLRTQ